MAFLLSFFIHFFCLPCAQAAVVDGTAAKVGEKLITIREARLYQGVLVFGEGAVPSPKGPTPAELNRVVQKIIFEEMVYGEAKQFQIKGNPKKEAEQKVQSFRKKNAKAWNDLLSTYGGSDSAVEALLSRANIVAQFVDRRVETLTPIITQAEIERYYHQNSGNYEGRTLKELRPTIESILKKQKVEQGMQEWVRFLKKKYEVANLLENE